MYIILTSPTCIVPKRVPRIDYALTYFEYDHEDVTRPIKSDILNSLSLLFILFFFFFFWQSILLFILILFVIINKSDNTIHICIIFNCTSMKVYSSWNNILNFISFRFFFFLFFFFFHFLFCLNDAAQRRWAKVWRQWLRLLLHGKSTQGNVRRKTHKDFF